MNTEIKNLKQLISNLKSQIKHRSHNSHIAKNWLAELEARLFMLYKKHHNLQIKDGSFGKVMLVRARRALFE